MTAIKKGTMISKIVIVVCVFMIVLAVINGFTGFINSKLSWDGTAVCIAGFSIAIFAAAALERNKKM
nr:hypothetical protein [uncultured Anaerostipes sp.]